MRLTTVLESKDWTRSWQWSSLSNDTNRYKKDNRDLYCMPGVERKTLSVRKCTKYFNNVDQLNWKSFYQYVENKHNNNYANPFGKQLFA